MSERGDIMQTETANKITDKVKRLSIEQQEEVLEFVDKFKPVRRSLLDIWQEISKDVPQEEFDKIPTDASVNLDHYLYGVPKK
jgi:hypothetical protein